MSASSKRNSTYNFFGMELGDFRKDSIYEPLPLCEPNSPHNVMGEKKNIDKNVESRRGDCVVGDDYAIAEVGEIGPSNNGGRSQISQKEALMRSFWISAKKGEYNTSLKAKNIPIDRVEQFVRYNGVYSTIDELESLSFLLSTHCKSFNHIKESRIANHSPSMPLMNSLTISEFSAKGQVNSDKSADGSDKLIIDNLLNKKSINESPVKVVESNSESNDMVWKNKEKKKIVQTKPNDPKLPPVTKNSPERKMPFHAEIDPMFICSYHQWYGQKAKYCTDLCIWELASTMRCCPNHLQYGGRNHTCLPPCAFANHSKVDNIINSYRLNNYYPFVNNTNSKNLNFLEINIDKFEKELIRFLNYLDQKTFFSHSSQINKFRKNSLIIFKEMHKNRSNILNKKTINQINKNNLSKSIDNTNTKNNNHNNSKNNISNDSKPGNNNSKSNNNNHNNNIKQSLKNSKSKDDTNATKFTNKQNQNTSSSNEKSISANHCQNCRCHVDKSGLNASNTNDNSKIDNINDTVIDTDKIPFDCIRDSKNNNINNELIKNQRLPSKPTESNSSNVAPNDNTQNKKSKNNSNQNNQKFTPKSKKNYDIDIDAISDEAIELDHSNQTALDDINNNLHKNISAKNANKHANKNNHNTNSIPKNKGNFYKHNKNNKHNKTSINGIYVAETTTKVEIDSGHINIDGNFKNNIYLNNNNKPSEELDGVDINSTNDSKDLIVVDLRYDDRTCSIVKCLSNFVLTDVESRNMCYINVARNKRRRLRANDKKRRALAVKAMRAINKPNNTLESMNRYQQNIVNIYSALYKNDDTCKIVKPVLAEKDMVLYNWLVPYDLTKTGDFYSGINYIIDIAKAIRIGLNYDVISNNPSINFKEDLIINNECHNVITNPQVVDLADKSHLVGSKPARNKKINNKLINRIGIRRTKSKFNKLISNKPIINTNYDKSNDVSTSNMLPDELKNKVNNLNSLIKDLYDKNSSISNFVNIFSNNGGLINGSALEDVIRNVIRDMFGKTRSNDRLADIVAGNASVTVDDSSNPHNNITLPIYADNIFPEEATVKSNDIDHRCSETADNASSDIGDVVADGLAIISKYKNINNDNVLNDIPYNNEFNNILYNNVISNDLSIDDYTNDPAGDESPLFAPSTCGDSCLVGNEPIELNDNIIQNNHADYIAIVQNNVDNLLNNLENSYDNNNHTNICNDIDKSVEIASQDWDHDMPSPVAAGCASLNTGDADISHGLEFLNESPSINVDSLDYSFNDLINSISYSPLISENIVYDPNNALPTIINNNTSNQNRVNSDSNCSIISNKAKRENEFINNKFNAIMATIINKNKNSLGMDDLLNKELNKTNKANKYPNCNSFLNQSNMTGISTCGTTTDMDRIHDTDSIEISTFSSQPASPTNRVSFHKDHIESGNKVIKKVNQHTPVGTRAGLARKNYNKKRNQSGKDKI